MSNIILFGNEVGLGKQFLFNIIYEMCYFT